jgi:hypothetical protein
MHIAAISLVLFFKLVRKRYFAPYYSGLGQEGVLQTGLKIAPMAEAYDVALASHCPRAPIALAT